MPTTGADGPPPPAFVPLAAGRLCLRLFTPGDARLVQHFLGDEDLAKQTINIPYPFVSGMAGTWVLTTLDDVGTGSGYTLAVERLEDRTLLGAVGLIIETGSTPYSGHRAELGYWIARSYWGNGYATEAVIRMIRFGREELGLTEICACVFTGNRASERVLQKTGFYETVTREEDHPARGGLRSITYFELGRT